MKRNVASIVIAFFTLIVAFAPVQGYSQQLPCPYNIDWEAGDTTGWVASYGGGSLTIPGGVVRSSSPPPPPQIWMTTITTPVIGFTPGRVTLMDVSMGTDPHGGFPVVAPTGGMYSVKLGDNNTVSNGAERIQYVLNVPPTSDNYSINFLYAIVMEEPGGNHDEGERPRFTVTVKDAATGLPVKDGCYDLNFIVQPNLPGFFLSPIAANVYYKPWTRHTLNLSGSAGKTIIVEVTSGDCSAGGHFGYGYFDVESCGEFKVVLDSCNLNRGGATMRGPDGFMKYEWYNQDYSELVDTGQFVTFQPITTTSQIYNLILTPFPTVSFCPDTIKSIHLANINIDKIDTACIDPNTSILLDPNIYGGSGQVTYEWTEEKPLNTLSCTNCPTPTVTTPASNKYTVLVKDTSGCFRSEVMNIGVNENTIAALDDYVVCRPGYTQLDVNSFGPKPLTPVTCDTSDVPACATPAIITIGTEYREKMGTREDTSSVNSPFPAHFTSGRLQFILRKEDMYAAGMRNGMLTSLGFEVKDPGTANLNNFTISLACTEQGTLGGAFVAGTKRVFSANNVAPVAGWNDFTFDKPYNWDRDKNLVVEICFQNSIKDIPATVIVVNTGGSDAVLGYTIGNNGNVCGNGKMDDVIVLDGRPNVRTAFCQSPDKEFDYLWTPSIFLQDSMIKSPIAYVNKSIEYYVETIGGSDCLIKDTVKITVPIHDYSLYPKDTSICYGDRFTMYALGTPASVQWYEVDVENGNSFSIPNNLSCNDCDDPTQSQTPIARPLDTTLYAVVYKDEYNCLDTYFVNVIVRPLPPVRILNNDTTIKYGQSIQLLASGAYLYSWSPLSSITHPNLANPHVAPTEPTTFYVWGLADDGCRNIDSVYINIDYRDNLFVPSAFTPNGDGKNDVFRVSNITFQKLQEFRVFNRWGQEIYSTTDPERGWDGSWKGVPQDMGVYQYLIKVAYPDGYIETYKGDVTLIR